MLVITRQPAEAIIVEIEGVKTKLEIEILAMSGRNIRIGFKASREMRVYRKEIYAREKARERAKQQQNPSHTEE